MTSILERYEEMLDRLYSRLPEKRSKKALDLPELQIEYVGQKAIIKNFSNVSERLNRDPRIVMRYLLKHLAKPGAINPSGQLEIFGTPSSSTISKIFMRFLMTYVRCPTCGSIDTDLVRNKGKVWFLKCLACGAESSIEAI